MVSTNLKRLRGKRRFLKANVDMKVLSNTIAYFLAIYADSKIFSNMEGGGVLLKGKCHEMKGQKNLRFYLQLLTFVQTDLLFLSILLINIFFFVLLIFGRIGYCTLQEITLVCSFMFIYVRHTITGYKTGYHWSTTLEQLTFSPYSAFFREQCWRQCTTKVRTTICF